MLSTQVQAISQVSTYKRRTFKSAFPGLSTIPALLFITLAQGCGTTQPRDDQSNTSTLDIFGRTVARTDSSWGGSKDEENVRIPSNLGPNAWTIVLAAVPSDDPGHAEMLLHQVRTLGRLPDAFIMERAGKRIVAVGSFRNPTDPIVKAELQRVQTIEVEGVRVYENAFLVPPSGELSRGSIPEYDLRNVYAEYGRRAVYTLQVAVYSHEGGGMPSAAEQSEIRRTAERAVVALRQTGEQAFYYHGPNRSMVTIGVFGAEDHDVQDGFPIESPRLVSTRSRHPHNLLNGRTIIETTRASTGGQSQREQPSFLVAIPRN